MGYGKREVRKLLLSSGPFMFYSDCRPNLLPSIQPPFFPFIYGCTVAHSIPNVDNSIRSIRARVNLSHNGHGGQVSPHLPKH